MDDYSNVDDLDEVEKKAENLLKEVSELKLEKEISNLENIVEGVISELADLDKNFPNIIQSIKNSSAGADQNYLMAVRRLQNAMKLYILDGVNKLDKNMFDQGLEFYENAKSMILATGDQAELDQLRNEFAQLLFKVLSMTKDKVSDEKYTPFILKACDGLAEINEQLGQYDIASTFRRQSAYFSSKTNPLVSDIEYLHALIDHLLSNNIKKAENINSKLKLKHIKSMGDEVLEVYNSKNTSKLEDIKGRIEVLMVQRGLNPASIMNLLETFKREIEREERGELVTEELIVPTGAKPLSEKTIQNIQQSLSKGIQQITAAYPNVQISAQIDTQNIVAELKEVITSEISKEIKSLSNDIISTILKNMPAGAAFGAPAPRSAGQISDDVPDIQVVEGGPREKPERPKLDDMLDSIIVCE